MLRFISSLFSNDAASSENLDEGIINEAIERAVAATDPRFRFLPNYSKRLRVPVIHAAEHIMALDDRLPPAVALDKQAFSNNPAIRTLFASPLDLPQIMGESAFVTDYLEQLTGPLPDQLYGLLSMVRTEQTVFGMDLENERLVQDKKQELVSFSDYRFAGISGNEADTRREITRRGFDFLLQMALARIANTRESRDKLGARQRLLLQKLNTMRKGNWGLGADLGEEDKAPNKTVNDLEAELEDTEKALQQLGPQEKILEHGLEILCDVLQQAESWLGMRDIKLRLDYRGVKISAADTSKPPEQSFTELYSDKADLQRICLLGYYPRNELPERPDMVQQARRYLG
ncbi:MAG: hypothetical protein KZQ58_05400 [gamma proteobacterium symbiont of Bathyaustriella thionipta]|nr:hypothetical protein [gamma proteobacterium symbiont of Bathyaustriella thionipta]